MANPRSSQHTTRPIRQERTLRWFTASTTRGSAAPSHDRPCDQADPDRISAGHEPEPVVLDLVNPVGAGRGLVGGGRKAGLNEACPVSRQALTQQFDRHGVQRARIEISWLTSSRPLISNNIFPRARWRSGLHFKRPILPASLPIQRCPGQGCLHRRHSARHGDCKCAISSISVSAAGPIRRGRGPRSVVP